MNSSFFYALLAGFCGALASLFGKLSGGILVHQTIFTSVIFFGLMIASNALMWTFFVKALHSTSTLSATLLSSSVNFLASAFFGYAIFGETVSLLWWSGWALIVLGMILVYSDQPQTNKPVRQTE